MEKYRVRSRWVKMLSRCEDEDNLDYHNYGGRGIDVCEEWHIFNKFYEWCIESGIEAHLQIDRIDNDKGYSPENCKFVTRKENSNNKRTNRWITAWGETKTISQWIDDPRCLTSPSTIWKRISIGWSPEDSISKKPTKQAYAKYTRNRSGIKAFDKFKTIDQWILDERCVVSRSTLIRRMGLGWDIEEAITMKTGNRRRYKPNIRSKFYEHEGVSKTLFQWAKEDICQVSYKMLWQRVEEMRWDIGRALLTPPRKAKSSK